MVQRSEGGVILLLVWIQSQLQQIRQNPWILTTDGKIKKIGPTDGHVNIRPLFDQVVASGTLE